MGTEENGRIMGWYRQLTWLVWWLHGSHICEISATYTQFVRINGIGLTVKFLNTHRNNCYKLNIQDLLVKSI